PGPVKEQVYVPDSDRDTVPDSVDPYDHDFNNNQIEDSQTNFDVDEDLVQDYPRGTDCVLETILQDFFPDPYKGREVRVDICPEGPGRLTGEDYINIFIDIDGAVGGYSVGPIFADYLLQITGINSLITSREFLQFDGGQDPFAWEWIPTGSAPEAELDTERLEARAEITGRQLDMFEVVIQASDWKDNLDETDVARRGRSITRGSFGDFDTRFKSMSYESFFSDEADKVSFRRRNSYLTWSLPEEIQWVDGTDSMVLGTLNPSPLAIDDNGAVYADAYSGLDVSIEYLFETNRLKENIVLDESFQDISRNGQLSFRSHLEYSNSLMIYAEGEETDGWTQVEGGLTFHERNSRRFHVMSPYSVDSQGDVLDCHYLYEAEERLLDIRCDSNWFLTASYPVILDPTVSVYTLENDGTLGQAGEKFGHSVAIGDFNNDGYADVLTGAPYATVSSVSNAGAAYVYYGPFSGDDTSPDVYIEGSTTDAYLGWAVTSGLFNDDDYWDAVVSQKDNDVYAYYGSSSWSGQENTPDVTFDESSITDDSGEEGFGMSLHACNFDYDGTSLNFDDLLIGAPFKNIGTGQPGGNYDGGVYAFVSVFAGTETGEDHLLRPEDNKDKGQFGFSIGCGKIDSDSKWDVVVGEPWNTTLDGSVQIFYGDEINAVTETPNEWLENEVADERFGFSVAVGDMDTDSYADILVGAPYSDEGGADIGRAYVYQAETDGSGLLAQSAPDLDIAGWAAGSLFGFNVSIGDFYGDGQGDAIIAAPYNDSTNVYGSIFVFDDPIGGDAVVDDAVSGDQASEHFGWDVACGQFSNDVNLVVAGGSPDWDDGSPSETDAGRVMVFMIPENLEMVLIIAILLAIPIAVRGKKRKSF
ncbi:MAG: FG-GAP repeat protein, partial [Methanobacteriota archaeon]